MTCRSFPLRKKKLPSSQVWHTFACQSSSQEGHFQGTKPIELLPKRLPLQLNLLKKRYLLASQWRNQQINLNTFSTNFHHILESPEFGQQTLSKELKMASVEIYQYICSLFAQKTLSPRSGRRLWPFHLKRQNQRRRGITHYGKS